MNVDIIMQNLEIIKKKISDSVIERLTVSSREDNAWVQIPAALMLVLRCPCVATDNTRPSSTVHRK